jgi:hypothetical protein
MWTTRQLDAIAQQGQVELEIERRDGSWRPAVRVGVVRLGDALYVRSYRGPDGAWYRAALRTRRGRLQAAGGAYPITLASDDAVDETAVDMAYRDAFGNDAGVRAMQAPGARATTLRVDAADT